MTVRTFSHLTMVALLSAFAWITTAPLASANQEAEAFTQHLIDDGVAILRDNSGGDQARRAKFRTFITQYADASWAALFTLGPYRRGAAKADIDTFVDAFREYAIAIYESNLNKYKGESLHVTGSVDNKPGDVTVDTLIADNHGGADKALRVSFRLFGAGGNYKFVDIRIEGAWISQSQLEQFRSILSKNGGNIPDLTHELVERTQRINNGGEHSNE